VSHQPERKHKNCLNCGIMVKGRYCQRCGQENIVTKQTFWTILKHFVFDIFHFDGKFFDTLKMLFAKPGRVPLEYASGKRMKYLDPVRMYLFTSAIFFLIFFATSNFQPVKTQGFEGILSKSERLDAVFELNARNQKDSLNPIEKQALKALLDSSLKVELLKPDDLPVDSVIYLKGEAHGFRAGIDSSRFIVQSKDWFGRLLERKTEKIMLENEDDPERGFKEIGLKIMHRLPYMLFVSLPFFALILKLIYAGRKQLYYSDHILFTLYHYIFSFLLLLFFTGLAALIGWLKLNIMAGLVIACIIFWVYYLYRGLKVFYGQSRLQTIVKFILLNVLGIVVFVFLVVLFALFSIIEF
jgi:hypothetical protein